MVMISPGCQLVVDIEKPCGDYLADFSKSFRLLKKHDLKLREGVAAVRSVFRQADAILEGVMQGNTFSVQFAAIWHHHTAVEPAPLIFWHQDIMALVEEAQKKCDSLRIARLVNRSLNGVAQQAYCSLPSFIKQHIISITLKRCGVHTFQNSTRENWHLWVTEHLQGAIESTCEQLHANGQHATQSLLQIIRALQGLQSHKRHFKTHPIGHPLFYNSLVERIRSALKGTLQNEYQQLSLYWIPWHWRCPGNAPTKRKIWFYSLLASKVLCIAARIIGTILAFTGFPIVSLAVSTIAITGETINTHYRMKSSLMVPMGSKTSHVRTNRLSNQKAPWMVITDSIKIVLRMLKSWLSWSYDVLFYVLGPAVWGMQPILVAIKTSVGLFGAACQITTALYDLFRAWCRYQHVQAAICQRFSDHSIDEALGHALQAAKNVLICEAVVCTVDIFKAAALLSLMFVPQMTFPVLLGLLVLRHACSLVRERAKWIRDEQPQYNSQSVQHASPASSLSILYHPLPLTSPLQARSQASFRYRFWLSRL